MLTALGGLPLVVQAFRSLGLPGSVNKGSLVVTPLALLHRQVNAAGGECLDDFERLRADPGRHRTRRTHLVGENSLSSVRAAQRRSTRAYGLIQVPRVCRSVKHVPLSTDRGLDHLR